MGHMAAWLGFPAKTSHTTPKRRRGEIERGDPTHFGYGSMHQDQEFREVYVYVYMFMLIFYFCLYSTKEFMFIFYFSPQDD